MNAIKLYRNPKQDQRNAHIRNGKWMLMVLRRWPDWARSPSSTYWMSLAIPVLTAMLVQTLVVPSHKNISGVLRRAFIRYGLPEQISLDHDSAFYDNKSASPFPSVIHLWLIGWGVQVRFIHKRPPLEHSRIERHHQTIAGLAFEGQTFADVNTLQRSLQARMLFLNQEYRTRALDGQPPFQAFPQARHSGRLYCLKAEEQLFDMQRILDYLQSGPWFRQISSVGTFSLGGHIYNATTHFTDQAVEITFNASTRKLTCLPKKGIKAFLLDVQGLTKAELLANPLALPSFSACQLALPLAYPDTTL